MPDPTKRLQGHGNQVRLIRLKSERTLDAPEVRELINMALHRAPEPFDPKHKAQMEIRAFAKKQRPRRVAKK